MRTQTTPLKAAILMELRKQDAVGCPLLRQRVRGNLGCEVALQTFYDALEALERAGFISRGHRSLAAKDTIANAMRLMEQPIGSWNREAVHANVDVGTCRLTATGSIEAITYEMERYAHTAGAQRLLKELHHKTAAIAREVLPHAVA